MGRLNFLTVPEELLETAERAVEHYQSLGYRVTIEKREIGFPFTPALSCSRTNTQLLVEVDDQIRHSRLQRWAAYAKSTGRDTRIVVVLPPNARSEGKEEDELRALGIGLLMCNPSGCVERITARDLALGVELPELSVLPRKARELLGPAYEQFARSQWREGFEEACQAFEVEARRYLKLGMRNGRVVIQTRRGPLAPAAIDKATIGKLADYFSQIQHQNGPDAIIGQTLKSINKDRIGVAHKKSSIRTEKRLRQNVGRHMWAFVDALTEMLR